LPNRLKKDAVRDHAREEDAGDRRPRAQAIVPVQKENDQNESEYGE
jgi:hypothetical protein